MEGPTRNLAENFLNFDTFPLNLGELENLDVTRDTS